MGRGWGQDVPVVPCVRKVAVWVVRSNRITTPATGLKSVRHSLNGVKTLRTSR